MKLAILGLLAMASIQASAQTSGRIYRCTSGSDYSFGIYGKETSDLKSAQKSAYQACLNDSGDVMSCRVNSCWSKNADGSDVRTESSN